MTTLSNRPNTALVVVDVQNDVVSETWDRAAVVANIVTAVDKARAAEIPVVWVQHSSEELAIGSPGWELVPDLARAESEALVPKLYPDAFEDTALENVLAEAGIGEIVLVGAQSDECIRSTLHGALARGYDVTLVGDAHTTEDLSPWGAPPPDKVIAHTNLYWGNHKAPGRTAAVVDTKDLNFSK
jgi:nicotinamidase-related amidase